MPELEIEEFDETSTEELELPTEKVEPAAQESPEQQRLKTLEAELKRQQELMAGLSSRPVEVTVQAPTPPVVGPDPNAQIAALEKYIDENFIQSPGKTVVQLLQGLRGAIEENYVKPQQLERAQDWEDIFLERKENKDRLYSVVEPLYRKRRAAAGNSVYSGTRKEVFDKLETIWQAAAGDVAYEAARQASLKEAKERAEAERRAQAPPPYATSQTGGPGATASSSGKVRIPRDFVTMMRRANMDTKAIIDTWETVKDTWGKTEA